MKKISRHLIEIISKEVEGLSSDQRIAIENLIENYFNNLESEFNFVEKDSNNNPRVEIIDETHQKFNGVIYKKHKTKGLYKKFINYKEHILTQDVWIFYKEELPEGNIRHKDGNIDNNNIENLYISNPIKVYPICGKEFKDFNGLRKTCSKKCAVKMKNRIKYEKIPTEIRTCAVCGREYETKIDSESITCSNSCASKIGRGSKWKQREIRNGLPF